MCGARGDLHLDGVTLVTACSDRGGHDRGVVFGSTGDHLGVDTVRHVGQDRGCVQGRTERLHSGRVGGFGAVVDLGHGPCDHGPVRLDHDRPGLTAQETLQGEPGGGRGRHVHDTWVTRDTRSVAVLLLTALPVVLGGLFGEDMDVGLDRVVTGRCEQQPAYTITSGYPRQDRFLCGWSSRVDPVRPTGCVLGQERGSHPPGAGSDVDTDRRGALDQFGQVQFDGLTGAQCDTTALGRVGGPVGGVDVHADRGTKVLGVAHVRGQSVQFHAVRVVAPGKREPRTDGGLDALHLGDRVVGHRGLRRTKA